MCTIFHVIYPGKRTRKICYCKKLIIQRFQRKLLCLIEIFVMINTASMPCPLFTTNMYSNADRRGRWEILKSFGECNQTKYFVAKDTKLQTREGRDFMFITFPEKNSAKYRVSFVRNETLKVNTN
jgi:hypothetical protein